MTEGCFGGRINGNERLETMGEDFMDLLTLNYFTLICREKSITKVADDYFISRQALSKSMIKLEEELDAKLLIRSRMGIEVTKEGRCLHEYAEKILKLWEEAKADMESIRRTSSRTIRVAYGQMIYNLWPADHVEDFKRFHPDIHVEVEILLPDLMCRGLLDQSLDVAITGSCYSPHFSRTLLLHRPLYALVGQNDPLAAKPQVAPRDLENRTLLFLPNNTEFTERLIRFFANEQIRIDSLYAVDSNIATILKTILERQAVYLTAGSFSSVITMNNIKKLPFACRDASLLPSKDLCAVMLKKRDMSQEVRQYIDYLRDHILS